jgi:hypothetical protein
LDPGALRKVLRKPTPQKLTNSRTPGWSLCADKTHHLHRPRRDATRKHAAFANKRAQLKSLAEERK